MIDKDILVLSDIHSQEITLEKILKKTNDKTLEACIVAGDITNFNSAEGVIKILKTIVNYIPNVYFVLGNCDPLLKLTDKEYEELKSLNIYWIGKEPLTIDNCLLVGFNGTRIEQKKAMKIISDNQSKKICLVTHIPPYNTLADSVSPIRHIGSNDLREIILKNSNIFLNICGHVHEAPSISKLNEAMILNPGPVTLGHYALIRISRDLEVDAQLKTIYDDT